MDVLDRRVQELCQSMRRILQPWALFGADMDCSPADDTTAGQFLHVYK